MNFTFSLAKDTLFVLTDKEKTAPLKGADVHSMVNRKGFEPLTSTSVALRSIQLS